MKLKPFALLAFAATIVMVGCSDDPTAEGDGEPLAIIANRSQTTVARNAQFTLIAYAIDRNNRRIPGQLNATSAGPAVVIDSVRYFSELTETRIFARGTQPSAEGTDVTIQGHGLTATTKVIVQ